MLTRSLLILLTAAACADTDTVIQAPANQVPDVAAPPEDAPAIGDEATGAPDGDAAPEVTFTDERCESAADCIGRVEVPRCGRPLCEGGKCAVGASPDGTPCPAGDPCLVDATCTDGECTGGQPLPCEDGNPCTADACDPEQGCVHSPAATGCDDGNACTLADHCVDGECVAGNSVCPCTTDEECKQWDDGNLCTGTLFCQAGVCKVDPASVVTCQAGAAGPCELHGCLPHTGDCVIVPMEDGTACSDGDLCTVGDTCQSGACAGGASACSCGDDADCLAYDDGDLCNGVMICQGGVCQPDPDTIVTCGDGGPCASGACNPATGQCVAGPLDGAGCDDGDPCTTGDACADDQCAGTPRDCDDDNPCTDDACDAAGECVHTPNSASCDDDDPCTQGDTCAGGACVPGEDVCSCTVPADCVAFDDGNPCNGTLVCQAGQCVPQAGTEVVCDQTGTGDCAANVCNPATGLCEPSPVNDGAPCFDGDPCTEGEHCTGGVCGGVPSSCACQPATEPLTCLTDKLWANDAFGSTDNVDGWSCTTGDFSGHEFAWPVAVQQPTAMTVSLSDEGGQNVWLFLLEDGGEGCGPASCVKAHPTSVSFVAWPDQTQYVVIDGRNGDVGKLNIHVECSAAFESSCSNGFDDDNDGASDCVDSDCDLDPWCAGTESCTNGQDDNNDGQVDCDDPDCAGQPICQQLCTSKNNAYCGFSQFWATGGFSASYELESYSCAAGTFDGPEMIYTFNSSKAQTVTLTLPQAFPGAQLFVMQHQPGGCNGAHCIAGGKSPLSFFASPGVTYYISVDAALGASGDYQLQIGCQ